MKTALPVILLASVLGACGSSDSGDSVAEPAAPAKIILPAPTATALAVGGSLDLARVAGVALAEPADKAWADVAAHQVALTLAPPVHQSVNLRHDPAAEPVPVTLQAASDGETLYLRLRWPDASADSDTSRTSFADGVAIQFALAGGEQTSFMMGGPGAAVNLWYWRADLPQPQNLAAGGFGSTTALPDNGLRASAIHTDSGDWVVVFSRPLNTDGEHQVNLNSLPVQLGLATWQGQEGQRDGLKHVTMGWLKLVASS